MPEHIAHRVFQPPGEHQAVLVIPAETQGQPPETEEEPDFGPAGDETVAEAPTHHGGSSGPGCTLDISASLHALVPVSGAKLCRNPYCNPLTTLVDVRLAISRRVGSDLGRATLGVAHYIQLHLSPHRIACLCRSGRQRRSTAACGWRSGSRRTSSTRRTGAFGRRWA